MSFIKDLVTLDVVTVTGTMEVTVKDREKREVDGEEVDGQSLSVIDFDELFNRINGMVQNRGKLSIVAATRINIDRDTYNFVSDEVGEGRKELIELHFKSVDMASKSRAEIVSRLLPGLKRKK